jgi:amino acid transporter
MASSLTYIIAIVLVIIIAVISLNIAATEVGKKGFESTKEGDGKTNYEYLGVVSIINIIGLVVILIFAGIGLFISKNVSGTNTSARLAAGLDSKKRYDETYSANSEEGLALAEAAAAVKLKAAAADKLKASENL